MPHPKQHHYVPETYLKNFCADDGTIWVHDKWTGSSFQSRPKSILKESFYYAQPDHKNKIWNFDIENFFSQEIEASWPATAKLIENGPPRLDELENLYMFLTAQRVRVPNCRKAIEYTLQQHVRLVGATIKTPDFLEAERSILSIANNALGKNFETLDQLYDEGIIDITIDPHQSLLAMAHLTKGFEQVVTALQLHFVKNNTPIDFQTNDNPVIYFPLHQSPAGCSPYQFHPQKPFEFIFPISKRYCLYHNSSYPIAAEQIVVTVTEDVSLVKRINHFIGAFADRYLVSSQRVSEIDLPTRNRAPRPVAYWVPTNFGDGLVLNFEMGEPLRLPKWNDCIF